MKRFLRDISVEVVGAIIGAFLISILFFTFSDFIFKAPNLNGKWYAITSTDITHHKPFQGMILIFEVIIHQKGENISGTAERIAEIVKGNRYDYDYEKRVRVEVDGSIDRNFLSKDKVNIHWLEHGNKRDSSAFFNILRFNDHYMFGEFNSTVANSQGKVEWVRDLSNLKKIKIYTESALD